ncbi:MAG: TonB family protein [candidate division NC10 bacterium]|nr:TonB family protein [candidate division NC10 bacterium]MDE2321617.1 TonB family protein [candidate division NC10 bacterium]
MLTAVHPQIRNFLVFSLLAHLVFIGLLSVMGRSIQLPADRPLQVRIVDQPIRTPTLPPRDRHTLGEVTARAQRPATKAGPPRTPNSSGIPHLASASSRPAMATPPAASSAVAGSGAPSTHRAALTPWTPPPLLTLKGPAVAPSPKTAQVEPLESEDVGRSVRPSNLRGQLAMLWKSLDAGQYSGQGADAGEEGDTGSSAGPTVSLDSQDSRFASYLLGVKRRIESVWSYPSEARGLSGNLVVTFGITRDGRLRDLQLTQTSGIAPLDNEAIRAIRQATPFSPFPERMHFERLNIRAAFYYHVSHTSFRNR